MQDAVGLAESNIKKIQDLNAENSKMAKAEATRLNTELRKEEDLTKKW